MNKDIDIKTHPASSAMALAFVEDFKRSGAENFLTVSFVHKELGKINIITQRVEGKTPEELMAELETKIKKREQQFSKLHNAFAKSQYIALANDGMDPDEAMQKAVRHTNINYGPDPLNPQKTRVS